MTATPRSVADLLADNTRLRNALKPFAEAARGYETRHSDTRLISTAVAEVNVGHLRRARAVLERLP